MAAPLDGIKVLEVANWLAAPAAAALMADLGADVVKVEPPSGDVFRGFILRSIGYDVIPSQGNFVFSAPPDRDGRRVYDGLYSRKILVRHFSDLSLSHGLRISIGMREEMEVTLAALKEIG